MALAGAICNIIPAINYAFSVFIKTFSTIWVFFQQSLCNI